VIVAAIIGDRVCVPMFVRSSNLVAVLIGVQYRGIRSREIERTNYFTDGAEAVAGYQHHHQNRNELSRALHALIVSHSAVSK